MNNINNIGIRKYYIFITPFFPQADNWRGAYVLDQVKAIKRNSNYNVVVFLGGNPKTNKDYEIDGVRIYYYKTRETPSNVFNGIFNSYNSRQFVKRVLEVGINPNDVAFVHCHVSMRAACGLALKELNPNIKVLLQHHDLDPFNLRSGVIGRYNSINIRYRSKKAIDLYNKVDLHICISKACKESLLAFPGFRDGEVFEDYKKVVSNAKGLTSISPKSTYILYNGVDTSLFHKKSQRHKVGDTFRIGCIANFWELKGQITLIKAVEILINKGYKQIVLSLLGSGDKRKDCEEYIENHNMSAYLEWPQEVSHDKLPDYYHSLDLFVLPSYFEGFGCVFTEAAACGVPFMGCYNQGYSEYVREKSKWLINPHDSKQLSILIESYINNKYSQVLNYPYDIDILINNYLNFLENM